MKYSLSPMDYYFYRPSLYTIQYVLEYDYHIRKDDLLQALSKLKDHLPLITATLKEESKKDVFFQITDQLPSVSTQVLLKRPDLTLPQEVDKFLDPVVNTQDSPLIKFKLTYIGEYTFVGVSFSHILGDGHSFMLFMNSLSRLMMNLPVNDKVTLDRNLLYKSNPTAPPESSLENLFLKTGYITPRPTTPPETIFERGFYQRDTIENLKQASDTTLSSNSLLMALLLQKYSSHIPKAPNGKIIVRCPVDYRKIHPQIDSSYFGNAVKDAVTFFDPSELKELALLEIAKRIQMTISDLNQDEIHDSLKALDDLRVEYSTSIFNELGCPGLLVTNLTRMKFHEINLGQGYPLKTYHASQNPRLAIILSHPEGYEVIIKMPK